MSVGIAEAMKPEKRTVTIPAGTREIGNEYAEDKTVTEIVLPEGMTAIGDGAFSGCCNLERINLPEGLRTIGDGAFLNCISLTVPPLPVSLTRIGDGAFGGCLKVKRFRQSGKNGRYTVRGGCIYGPDNELVQYPAGRTDYYFEVPERTEGIRDLAFFGNRMLYSIGLNDSLDRISGRSFIGCPNLEEVSASEYSRKFSSPGRGMLLDKDGGEIVFVSPGQVAKEYFIRGAEKVGPWSLAACTSLKHLIICESIDSFDPLALGDSVKIRRMSVEPDVECSLPFIMKDENGRILPPDELCGFTYRLGKRGEFVRDGPCERSDPEPGDTDWGPDLMEGREKVFSPVSVKGCGFDDVIGLDDVKMAVRRHLILPSEHPDLFRQFGLETGTGVLMYGPPGTGKTMIARAIAQELDAKFFSVKPSDILDCWVGSDEKNIRQLFESARKHSRQVIFFDDFDSLGTKRGLGYQWCDTLVTEILTQMQGLERYNGTLLVLAATNRPWALDTALTRSGRFGIHLKVGLPEYEAREAMFRRKLSGIPIDGEIDYALLAERTEGYNGADIEEVCKAAKTFRVEEIGLRGGTPGLCMGDLECALKYVKPTVSARDIEDIDWYSENGTDPRESGEYRPRGKHSTVQGYS